MARRRPITFLAIPVIALVVAGCGSSNSATVSTSSATTSSGHTATVGVATNGSLGKILVDSQGRTLYLFQADKGTKSACTGACAVAWPPVRASGKPVAGSGITASKLGTTARSDGKPQVTYNGHPLYGYVGDQKAGDTNGQGVTAFGGGWFALTASGRQVTATAPGSGGGNGY
jgi:predicted lipoprotein with Yx(FWY)xxD motif